MVLTLVIFSKSIAFCADSGQNSALEADNVNWKEISEVEAMETHQKFIELFPDEMRYLEQINLNKHNEQDTYNVLNTNPIIDSEKATDDGYYRLIIYSNGVHTKLVATGGKVEPKGGGTTNFTDVTAYAQFHPDGLYLIMGHRMSTILSYTTHTTQFDVINSRKIGAQQFTKGAYVSDQLLTETQVTHPFILWDFSGRTAISPEVYNHFAFKTEISNLFGGTYHIKLHSYLLP